MTTHNIHPVPKNNREWNESQPPGSAPIMQSFAREEVAIPVKCNVHPWMKAYIAVLGSPYFQVTGKDGSSTSRTFRREPTRWLPGTNCTAPRTDGHGRPAEKKVNVTVKAAAGR